MIEYEVRWLTDCGAPQAETYKTLTGAQNRLKAFKGNPYPRDVEIRKLTYTLLASKVIEIEPEREFTQRVMVGYKNGELWRGPFLGDDECDRALETSKDFTNIVWYESNPVFRIVTK